MTGKEEQSIGEDIPESDAGKYFISKIPIPEGMTISRSGINQLGTRLPYSRYANFPVGEEKLPPQGPCVSG